MAETFRNDSPAETNLSSSSDSAEFSPAPPGEPGAPPELPETSAVSVPGRSSNAHLNRSAETIGRGMGNAVAGVKSIPQQFERLRSRIHLVERSPAPESQGPSLAEVAGDWRDAVDGSVSEMSQAAQRYRVEFLDRAQERLFTLRRSGERRLFELLRSGNRRLDKIRRTSREQPLQFIGGCAAAAFALGVAMRIWRSNHE